jgi:glycosyltransferase involved in cell wall biosynthesis
MKNLKVLLINPARGYMQDFMDWISSNVHEITIEEKLLKTIYSPSILTKKQNLIQIIINVLQGVRPAFSFRSYEVILLNGNLIAPPILLLRRLFGMNLHKSRIIVIHFFLNDIRHHSLVKKLVRYIFDQPGITMIALSKGDQEHYAKLFKHAHVDYYPLCFNDKPDLESELVENGEYIFSGGWTNRDYECLISAARRVSHQFIIICSEKNKLPELPNNVKVLRDIPNTVFKRYVRDSQFVVVPLKNNVGAAGQMVALAALMYGKPVIYTDLPCISDYIENGVSGLAYRQGDDVDLEKKINLLVNEPSLSESLGKAASERFYALFRPECFFQHLTHIICKS